MSGVNKVVPEVLSRKDGLIIAALFIPFIFAWNSSFGLMIFGSCVAVSSVSIAYRRFKNRRWLWLSIILFLCVHVLIIFGVRDRFDFRFSIIILPIFLLDFIGMSCVLSAIGNRFEEEAAK